MSPEPKKSVDVESQLEPWRRKLLELEAEARGPVKEKGSEKDVRSS